VCWWLVVEAERESGMWGRCVGRESGACGVKAERVGVGGCACACACVCVWVGVREWVCVSVCACV
jgi:hypothetical protein